MRRVLQVLHGWPPEALGGTGLYVAALSRALQAAGHRVRLLAPGRRPGAHPVAAGGLAGWLLGPRRPPLRWRDTWDPPGARAAAAALLAAERPDVVHVHHLSGLPLALPVLAREAGARVVVTLHDYSALCPRGQLVDAEGQACAGPDPLRCPACAAGAAPAGRLGQLRARLQPGDPRRAAALDALSAAHVLLSPSRDLARRMGRLGAPPIARCPLPLVRPVPPAPPAPAGPVRLLFASAVLPTKGPDRLLRAFARLPAGAAHLTIAGPSPAFPGQPDFAADLQRATAATPGATWAGAVPIEQIPALLHAHDVLVLPSTWPENSPLVVREATAAGLRVLVGALGGAPELAPDATTIPVDLDDAGLADLLAAEVARGRGRAAPATWPTPAQHAAWLLDGPYGGAVAPRSQ